MGRTWLGLVVLAMVTSLPESVTGVSSVLWVKAPDITVGNLLGACVLNLAILAVADIFHPPGPILSAADRGHLLAAAFGVIMFSVASLGVMARLPVYPWKMGHVGISAPVLIVCYLVGMRSLYRYQRKERALLGAELEEQLKYDHIELKKAAGIFAFHSVVVAAAAIWLPRAAVNLAVLMDWHQSLVGTVFVALATTLPELAVTLSALRLGAVDLAVGNLLGSNLYNLALIGIMDLIYPEGPLLWAVVPEHSATGLMGILMIGISSAELVYRPPKKFLRWMSASAFLLAFLYAAQVLLQMLIKD
jgi:cation:H+ antiporter